ncbi:unnamed protein product, partial [Symbiodinium sp. CCMP2456]
RSSGFHPQGPSHPSYEQSGAMFAPNRPQGRSRPPGHHHHGLAHLHGGLLQVSA